MKKSDSSIHNICIAAIKRHTIALYDCKWTRFYEEKEAFTGLYMGMIADLEEEELPICSTVIDPDNWSVLTTRRMITRNSGQLTSAFIREGSCPSSPAIKDTKKETAILSIAFKNGDTIHFFIESGRASMVMIAGIQARLSME